MSEEKGAKKPQTAIEKAAAAEEKEKEKLRKSLTIRDRLMRRLEHACVSVEFDDDLGVFEIRCRLLAAKEQREVMRMQTKIRNIKDPDQYDTFMEEIYKYVAYPDGICLEPTLDLKFWKTGKFGINDLFRLLASSIEGSTKQLTEAKSFRDK